MSKLLTPQDIRKLEDAILRIESAVMRIELALKTSAKTAAPAPSGSIEALEEKINKLISWMPGLANSR